MVCLAFEEKKIKIFYSTNSRNLSSFILFYYIRKYTSSFSLHITFIFRLGLLTQMKIVYAMYCSVADLIHHTHTINPVYYNFPVLRKESFICAYKFYFYWFQELNFLLVFVYRLLHIYIHILWCGFFCLLLMMYKWI